MAIQRGKVKAPIRIYQNPLGILFFRKGDFSLRFGDIYTFKYKPLTLRRNLPKELLINWLPYWDKYPMMIFLEYRPRWKVVYGINLHYYPPEIRGAILDIVDLVKSRLKILVEAGETELTPLDYLNSEELFKEGIERSEIGSVDFNEQEVAESMEIDPVKDIDNILKGRRGINWLALSSVQNKFLRLLPIAFRNYKIRLIQRPVNFRDMEEKDRNKLLEQNSIIRKTSGGMWKMSDARKVARLASQNKDWKQYVKDNTK